MTNNAKNVILYTRVSSDEQTERLSIENQERALLQFCNNNGFELVGEDSPYKEDYSAKHFDMKRPEIKRIYEYCKKNPGKVDKVLFLRWDRYSRNVEFAFTYKRLFMDELGVEINAIEEPIDFNATDWPTWLAIRCSIAHTEDIKIARRTKEGIHEHLMRGEWCGLAPRGYKNIKADELAGTDHYVTVDPIVAPIIKKVFKEVAEGVEEANSIRRRLLPNVSKTSFYKMLRNKFYIGIIRVPAFQNYPETEVRGLHEPLINIETFEAVQDVLDGKRRKKPKLNKVNNPNLYLRKFIVCPICGHRITGATTRGHGGKYDYYCCNYDHKHLNIRADKANEIFEDYIQSLKPTEFAIELFREMLSDARGVLKKNNDTEIKKTQEEVSKLRERINRVNDMYFDGELSRQDREEQLKRYRSSIQSLERKIELLRKNEEQNLKEKLDYSSTVVENLGDFFSNASTETKIRLLGSIFNSEIEFDGKIYRTSDYNSVLDYIFQNINLLQGQKEEDSPNNLGKSSQVAPGGIEPPSMV